MRDFVVTLPDRFRVWQLSLRAWLDALALHLIDKYLASREEERTPKLLEFDELPVLYDFANFEVVPDKIYLNYWADSGIKWQTPTLQDETGVI